MAVENAGGAWLAVQFVMSARSRTADAMVGASSLCTLVAGVSIISPDLRAQMASVIAGDTTGQLSAMASRAVDFVGAYVRMAGVYNPDTTPLVGFGLVALVLGVMMFRT